MERSRCNITKKATFCIGNVFIRNRYVLLAGFFTITIMGCGTKEEKETTEKIEIKPTASPMKCDCSKESSLAQKCQSQVRNLTNKLNSANQEIKKLKETPEAIYQELISRYSDPNSTSEIDAYYQEADKYLARFPNAPESRAVKSFASKLRKLRPKYAKAEAKAKALEAVSELISTVGTVEDGITISIPAVLRVSEYLKRKNMRYDAIWNLPGTNYGEAMKDPSSERGKAMVVRGKVVQIQKDGPYFSGLICIGMFCNKVYYFITPGTTRGIVANKYARFAGILTQQYSYSNVRGGQTHSLLLVGYFQDQE